MTGPPSPKPNNSSLTQSAQQPGQLQISGQIPASAINSVDFDSKSNEPINEQDEEDEEEDEDGTSQLVSNLQQMDLLSLVLDLLERVMSGAVTAKTVDNEAGSIRSRIRVAKTWLQQLEQSGIAGAAAGTLTGGSIAGAAAAFTGAAGGRRDVYEEIEYLENMIDSKRDLLLRFKTVMGDGDEEGELMQLNDDIEQQDQQHQQEQQPQQNSLISDSQPQDLIKMQQQEEKDNQQQEPPGQLDQTGFVPDMIGDLDGTVPGLDTTQSQQPDLPPLPQEQQGQSQQQTSNQQQQQSQHEESKKEPTLQQDSSQQESQDMSMLDSLGLDNFEDSNFNFDF
ncbi:hypothetical protein D0Z00_000212 [Geotrichum galactomycetum]|uniref:Uncharacterized protein n=1 Tax=Geotrichum galactomycetum TaxID=27317 RepID=A0ACB6VAR1_9ASCO|nr:hypothetical protein D0Z00_000212 [Geotrichum candidum]